MHIPVPRAVDPGTITLILDVRDRPVLSKHGNFYEVSTISGDVAEQKWRGVGEGVLGQNVCASDVGGEVASIRVRK